MTTRDRILGAISWWIGLVGLAGLMSLSPPMHPAARRHCLLGLAGNAIFIMLRFWASLILPLDAASAFVTAIGCLWFLVVLANTISAAMGHDVFFFDVIAESKPSRPEI